jgi:hypothetical protein
VLGEQVDKGEVVAVLESRRLNVFAKDGGL